MTSRSRRAAACSSAVRQAADGTCTGAPIDLTAGVDVHDRENDFMATGGDGYPNVYARGTTQDLMDQVLADYITANTPVSPAHPGPHQLHDERAPRLPGGDPIAHARADRPRNR